MKRFIITSVFAACLLSTTSTSAVEMPPEDSRSQWKCAYPYTDSNCQTVMLAWAKDHGIPEQTFIDGAECSGCESQYFQDFEGTFHLMYAKCQKPFGTRLLVQDFLSPIPRYRESSSSDVGWNVVDWRFEACFETWGCAEFCSLQTVPPYCVKHYTQRWGLYVPITQAICSYGSGTDGNGGSTAPMMPPSSSSGPAPSGDSSQPPRDNTWYPKY